MTNGQSPAPPRVLDETLYWGRPPPTPSERLLWWKKRVAGGWRPNRRIGGLGYHESACYYGVYIWEWINVLSPLLYSSTG